MNYTDPKYYRLEPYHNPDNVDESKVPKGWRMRYEKEINIFALPNGLCSAYDSRFKEFSNLTYWGGISKALTYIVPVNEA